MKILLIFMLIFIGVIFTFFNNKIIQWQGGFRGKKGEYPINARKQSMYLLGIAALIAAFILILLN